MNLFFNHDGDPIPMEEWASLMEIVEYRRVASYEVTGLWISTVWLGINSNVFGPPLIFETAVFTDDGIVEMIRTPTHAEALAVHDRLVRQYTAVSN